MSEARTIETVADALKFLNDHEKRFFASNREIARLEKRNAALERVARLCRDALREWRERNKSEVFSEELLSLYQRSDAALAAAEALEK